MALDQYLKKMKQTITNRKGQKIVVIIEKSENQKGLVKK